MNRGEPTLSQVTISIIFMYCERNSAEGPAGWMRLFNAISVKTVVVHRNLLINS